MSGLIARISCGRNRIFRNRVAGRRTRVATWPSLINRFVRQNTNAVARTTPPAVIDESLTLIMTPLKTLNWENLLCAKN